ADALELGDLRRRVEAGHEGVARVRGGDHLERVRLLEALPGHAAPELDDAVDVVAAAHPGDEQRLAARADRIEARRGDLAQARGELALRVAQAHAATPPR